jgi:hypothetical protein
MLQSKSSQGNQDSFDGDHRDLLALFAGQRDFLDDSQGTNPVITESAVYLRKKRLALLYDLVAQAFPRSLSLNPRWSRLRFHLYKSYLAT